MSTRAELLDELDGRGRHAMRATFITLAQTDGARREIRQAVTHASAGLADVIAIRFAVGNRDMERDSRGRWLAIHRESGQIATSPRGFEPL